MKKLTEAGSDVLTKARGAIRRDEIGSAGFWMGYHDALFNVMDLPDLMVEDLKQQEGQNG